MAPAVAAAAAPPEGLDSDYARPDHRPAHLQGHAQQLRLRWWRPALDEPPAGQADRRLWRVGPGAGLQPGDGAWGPSAGRGTRPGGRRLLGLLSHRLPA